MIEDKKAIYAALVKAQAAARGVEKSSANQFHRYKYASAEAIIAEARDALNAAGLAVFVESFAYQPYKPDEAPPPVETKGGKRQAAAVGRVVVRYRVAHESGASLDAVCSSPVIPESGRPEDKAEATALTYNLGYYLRGLLLLPRVEEGTDVDQRDDHQRQGGSRRQSQQRHRSTREEVKAQTKDAEAEAHRINGKTITPAVADARETLRGRWKKLKSADPEADWDATMGGVQYDLSKLDDVLSALEAVNATLATIDGRDPPDPAPSNGADDPGPPADWTGAV
jgi:hypothetical protein